MAPTIGFLIDRECGACYACVAFLSGRAAHQAHWFEQCALPI